MGCHCDGGMIKRGPAPLHVRRRNAASVGKFLPFSLSLSPATKNPSVRVRSGEEGKICERRNATAVVIIRRGERTAGIRIQRRRRLRLRERAAGFRKQRVAKKGGRGTRRCGAFPAYTYVEYSSIP